MNRMKVAGWVFFAIGLCVAAAGPAIGIITTVADMNRPVPPGRAGGGNVPSCGPAWGLIISTTSVTAIGAILCRSGLRLCRLADRAAERRRQIEEDFNIHAWRRRASQNPE